MPLFVGVTSVLLLIAAYLTTQSQDWPYIFRPAAALFVTGHSPYVVHGFYNPPWVLPLLVPLAALPERLGAAMLGIVNLAAHLYLARKFGANRVTLAAFILTPHVLYAFIVPNLDFLVPLGLLLPARWGLLLVFVKQQLGAGMALYWLIEAWRRGGWRDAARTFAPLVILSGLSFALYGFWPLKALETTRYGWNISLFPYSLLIGLPLLAFAIARKRPAFTLGVSLLAAPYVGIGSLPAALLALVPHEAEMLAACAALWLLQIVTGRPF